LLYLVPTPQFDSKTLSSL